MLFSVSKKLLSIISTVPTQSTTSLPLIQHHSPLPEKQKADVLYYPNPTSIPGHTSILLIPTIIRNNFWLSRVCIKMICLYHHKTITGPICRGKLPVGCKPYTFC